MRADAAEARGAWCGRRSVQSGRVMGGEGQVGEGGAFQDILARFRAGLEGNNQVRSLLLLPQARVPPSLQG